MGLLPARCDNCGLIFVPRGFSGSESAEITVRNVVTPCPRCGEEALFVECTFKFTEEKIEVRNAPLRTLSILGSLNVALKAAQAGESEEEIVARLEEESPEFGRLARSVVHQSCLSALIVLLIYLLTTCSSHIQQTLDWNEMV
jgi:hypothetical protein